MKIFNMLALFKTQCVIFTAIPAHLCYVKSCFTVIIIYGK